MLWFVLVAKPKIMENEPINNFAATDITRDINKYKEIAVLNVFNSLYK